MDGCSSIGVCNKEFVCDLLAQMFEQIFIDDGFGSY